MIEIKLFDDSCKNEWDEFIENSNVTSFLLKRDFIEYHKENYEENSLMVYKNEKLIYIIPACKIEKTFSSFHFLTYGGIILSNDSYKFLDIEQSFREVIDYVKTTLNLKNITIKRIPFIYYKKPNEDDLYLMFKNDFKLIGRQLSSTFNLNDFNIPNKKKYNYRKCINNGIELIECLDSKNLIDIMSYNLKKYKKKPVHNYNQLNYLKSKFPNNIMFYEAKLNSEPLGGCIIFKVNRCIHIQYLCSTDLGRKKRVVDFIVNELVKIYSDYEFLDYGISTENNGEFLNYTLLNAKRELGFDSICYDIYNKEL
tara:strand:+ start:704 stop:1636 length:933 start_codon:yes stop_codon:yes gene_type:complete